MNKKLFLALAMVMLAFLLVAGCGGGGTEPPQEPEQPAVDSQPADSEPADSEPADSEPADSEPADSEPADSEPADSEPADSEPADSEPADSEPAEEPEQEPQQEADASGDLVFVSSADKPSCVDCHKADGDSSLTNAVAAIDGHPPVPVESVADCVPCHAADGDMPTKDVVHSVHYDGSDNRFVSNFEGSCVHCHKLAEDGTMPVGDLAPAGTNFVTVEVATVDKAPGGCTDCHKADSEYSLSNAIAELEGHPQVPAETGADCVSCHAEGSPLALSSIMHNVHLLGEHYKNYGNSCINCHDQGNNMAVKGL